MSPSWSNAIGQPLVFKAGGADQRKTKYEPFNTVMTESGGFTYQEVTLNGVALKAELVAGGGLFVPPVGWKVSVGAGVLSKGISYRGFSKTFADWSEGEATLLDVSVSAISVVKRQLLFLIDDNYFSR